MDRNLGKRINRLTVLSFVSKDARNQTKYLFQCDCGEYRTVAMRSVQSGATKECKACAKLTRSVCTVNNKHGLGKGKHNMSSTQLYNSWRGLKNRINHPPTDTYASISYCSEWESFECFKEDMEVGHFKDAQIDRVDNTKGYCKANCQWLTAAEHSLKTQEDMKLCKSLK